MKASDIIAIGDLAARAGVSVSAIRFYEAKGLIQSFRNRGRQRRFLRSDTRRIAFILIAQQLGLFLAPFEQAVAPTGQFIGDQTRDQIDGSHRLGLSLEQAGFEHGGHAAQAQLL